MPRRTTPAPRCTGPSAAAVLLLAAFVSLPGCGALQKLARPSAQVTGVRIQELSAVSAGLVFDVEVQNPYSVPLPLVDLDYRLASTGKPFLTGHAPVTGSVPAGGRKTLAVPARVLFADLLQALAAIRPGSVVPYVADLGLSVDAPAAGRLRLDLSRSGEFPVPAVPEVTLEGVDWHDLTLDRAGATLRVRVRNPNDFPFDLSRFAYALSLANTPVADSALEHETPFAPGATNTIQVPLSLSPRQLGVAVFQMLLGSGAGYSLRGTVDLETPYGHVRMPYEKRGETSFSR